MASEAAESSPVPAPEPECQHNVTTFLKTERDPDTGAIVKLVQQCDRCTVILVQRFSHRVVEESY